MKKPQTLVYYSLKALRIIGLLSIIILCTSCEQILNNLGKGLFEVFVQVLFILLLGSIVYFGILVSFLFYLRKWRTHQVNLTEVIKYKILSNKEKYPHLLHWLKKEGDLVCQIFPSREIEYSEPIISLINESNNVVWQRSFKYYMLDTALERLDIILESDDFHTNSKKIFFNPFALEKSKTHLLLNYVYSLTLVFLFAPLIFIALLMILGDSMDFLIPFFILIVFLIFLTWKLIISLVLNKR